MIIDPFLQRLASEAEQRQATSRRPGTRANHRSTLIKFVKFIVRCGGHFTRPTPQQVCMFFELCLRSARSPATIKNYASNLSSVYRRMGLDPAPFLSFKVKNALSSIDVNVRYISTPSLAVTPAILKRVVRITRHLSEGPTLVTAFVLMFHTFYRQSNLSARTSAMFDPTRQLTRGDVVVGRNKLTILHKWSKSHQSHNHRAITQVPAVPGSLLCPKDAYLRMLQHRPTRHSNQPLLTFRDGNHMPSTYLRRVWTAVLRAGGIPRHDAYTLHGLRRGAATHVIRSDPSAREDIKRHGLWQSDCVDKYLPPPSKVFRVLQQTL